MPGDRVLALPCVHHFHASCITPWLRKFSAICPICRSALFLSTHPTSPPPSPATSPAPSRSPPMTTTIETAEFSGTTIDARQQEGLSVGCSMRNRPKWNCRLSGNLLFGNIWDAPTPHYGPQPREDVERSESSVGHSSGMLMEVDPALGLAPTHVPEGVANSNAAKVRSERRLSPQAKLLDNRDGAI